MLKYKQFSDESVATKVYRKATHSDHYLQFDSHHPLIHMLGVFWTLSHRAEQVISDPDTLTNEKKHIKKSLGKCRYPDWVFRGNQKHHDERGGGGGGSGIENTKRLGTQGLGNYPFHTRPI